MRNPLTKGFIAANVVIFLVVFSMPEGLFGTTMGLFAFSGLSLTEVWRLFTSMFLHASASHLFFNMLGLYFFGKVVENEFSKKQWLLVYLGSGAAGSLVYGLTSTMPAVGASGCVFGLMGCATLLKPRKLIDMYVFPLPLGFISILYMLTQVTLSLMPASSMQIAYMAHIGGMLAGAAFTLYLRPKDAVKGLMMMFFLLAVLVVIFPVISILIGIGELFLRLVDGVAGFVLYGISKYLLSWVW